MILLFTLAITSAFAKCQCELERLYTKKTNDKENYKDKTNQYPKDDYRYSKFPSGRGYNNSPKQNGRENCDLWRQKTNPLDKSGNISCCAICQSIYHWVNHHPNNMKEEQSIHVKITLFMQDIHMEDIYKIYSCDICSCDF